MVVNCLFSLQTAKNVGAQLSTYLGEDGAGPLLRSRWGRLVFAQRCPLRRASGRSLMAMCLFLVACQDAPPHLLLSGLETGLRLLVTASPEPGPRGAECLLVALHNSVNLIWLGRGPRRCPASRRHSSALGHHYFPFNSSSLSSFA